MPTIESSFWADVFAHPGEAAPLLIFADWLEEHGEPSAALCCRWMGRRGKHPAQRLRYPGERSRLTGQVKPGRAVPAAFRWAWYPSQGGSDVCPIPDHAILPHLLFRALPGHSPDHAFYPVREMAVNDLRLALAWLLDVCDPAGCPGD